MANDKRKITEAYILKYIGALLPNSENKTTANQEIYKTLFASMSDKQFNDFMLSLKNGDIKLALIAPNLSEDKLSVERNLELAKELGHNFFERIWMKDSDSDSPAYLTPIPYLIVDLPLRRQAQLLVKKISIPEDNKSVDDMTGQPTGKSKGSKISYPEVQILASLNLEDTLTELMKIRGGDSKAFNASNQHISHTGGFSISGVEHLAGGVESTQTLKVLLQSAHLQNTL